MQMKLFFTIDFVFIHYLAPQKYFMEFAVCVVPAAPVRKRSSHKAEMVNQLLYGESMVILKAKHNWLKIQSMHDNYEGWLRNNLVTHIQGNLLDYSMVAGDLINTITVGETNMHLSMGSTLPGFSHGAGRIGELYYQFNGFSFNRNEIKPSGEMIRQLTMPWLNAPYLWGGRTPLGVDCSGFVQVIFKIMGLDLLRDAKLQAGQGMRVKSLKQAQCGDLAFFKNKKGRITHVGILLSPSQIIHASGKVRIDTIDEKGITNKDTGTRTHSLAVIRSYW